MTQAVTKGSEVPDINDLLFEREQLVEARLREQYESWRTYILKEAENKLPNRIVQNDADYAKVKIADAVLSALHNKKVNIPSMFGIGTQSTYAVSEEKVLELVDAVIHYTEMGADFKTIMKAVKDNETLMSEWERFMLMLRLAE